MTNQAPLSPTSPAQQALTLAQEAKASDSLAEGLAAATKAWALAEDTLDESEVRQQAAHLKLYFFYRTGALPELVAWGQEVLPLLRTHSDSRRLFEVLRWVAMAACETAQLDVALAHAHECHAVALQRGDKGLLSLAVNSLACCIDRMGDAWQAERLMQEALSLAKEHGQTYEWFAALNNLCAICMGKFYLLRDGVPDQEAKDSLRTALPHALEAQRMAQDMNQLLPTLVVQGNLAEIKCHLGPLAESREHITSALAMCEQEGYGALRWRLQISLGELQLEEGDPAAAWATLQESFQAAAGSDPRAAQLRLHHALARAARELGRADDALQHLTQYVKLDRARSVAQLHAQSTLFVTRVEAEQARLEAQRQRVRAVALEEDSRRDQLTGLGNRREVEQRLPGMLQEALEIGRPLAMVMLDVDHFKQVNDQFGHACGDQVLVTLGQLLRAGTRSPDLVARLGGEEFMIALADTDATQAQEVCERLRRAVANHPWHEVATALSVTVSMGCAVTPPVMHELLNARADEALYRAKAAGRNQVCMADMA